MEYQGAILAAGVGERLKPLSLNMPKPLLPIGNKPIMQYQIEAMRDIGITEIFIVVGYMSSQIIDRFKSGRELGVELHYVHQDKPLGIAHAIAQLEPYITKPFLTFLGDIFIVAPKLKNMLELYEKTDAGAIIAVKREKNLEYIRRNFSVILNEDGTVRKVIEKPRFVPNNLKGCGIYLFGLQIFDAIRQTPRTAMRDEYEITTSIQILINDGYKVFPAKVVEWDMNITIPCDLLKSNIKYLKYKSLPYLISNTSKLHPQCEVINSVIGDGVIVENPIKIRNSLILPNTILRTRENLNNQLISPNSAIYCSEKGDLNEN